MDPSQLSALTYGVNINRGNTTSALCAAVFLLYDSIICLEMEITHIWQAQWTTVKVLYLVSRYYGVAHCLTTAVLLAQTGLSPKFCSNFLWWFALGGTTFFTTIVNILLALRLYALYQKSTKILIFLIFLLVAELTGETWSVVKNVTFSSNHPIILPPALGIPITGCLWEPWPERINSYVAWIPCLTTEFIFFAMTVWKFIQTQILDGQTSISFKSLRSSVKFSPLMNGFAKDGSLFFFVVFCVVLINTIMALSDYTTWFLSWIPAIHSFASTRLVLSLRQRAYSKVNGFDDTYASTARLAARPRMPLNIPTDLSFRTDSHEMY